MTALDSPWRTGRLDRFSGPPKLLFGMVYEDWTIESAAFPAGTKVFCIASAGCTAMRLAASRRVTAVDINPVQLEYARGRAQGLPMRRGSAERLMAFGRFFLPLAGWTRETVEDFLALGDPARQIEYWKDRLDTRRFRWALDFLFSARGLAAFFALPFLRVVPEGFGAVMRARMARCWGLHPNRLNPYARALLTGESDSSQIPSAGNPIDFICADAAEYLEACRPGSFDGFSLSNILDGAADAYKDRLFAAVRRAGTPGSLLVRRSFAEPRFRDAADQAARDRSFLWGEVEVRPTGA